MTDALGDRQGQILVAIVREYIRTEDPVGSKHLVGQFNLAVSSATVRNDMSKLEELGYLHQPHTSAGRVPTDQGYRFFVDNEGPVKLTAQQRRELEGVVAREPGDLDDLLRNASEILSRATHLAAAALTPRLKESRLKHLDLTWVSPRRIVLVVIAEGGRVEKRIIEIETDIDEDDLGPIEGSLNAVLTGKVFSEAARIAKAQGTPSVEQPTAAASHAVARAVAAALEGFLADDQEITVAGAANLASNKALAENGTFARVFEVIERRVDLQSALSDAAPPASVRIGSELPVEDLQACSLVIAPYSPGAAIGVIGPTRMEYPRVIAAVTLMAQLLGDAVHEL